MKARLDGVGAFRNLVNSMTVEVQEQTKELVRETTLAIEADAKNLAPIDTGYLRRNIKSKIENGGHIGVVTSNAEYGDKVEYGTSKTPAQPYFNPAYERNIVEFKSRLKDIVEGR
ncbi:HK97 gp10 family phage protein [Cytobacillus kochii]|uniref:HK97-gp10 family putative phage morphogenesis protein n=1 Tax=Cytobacillus kochii TaxID=859143 RepID=UPI001CD6355C|nr:HK97-gp10 family putative phage morphogenesis protein [Cytobacillus kochii]MCA1025784.1 HK97 gp10 family phage protein [Cytobacillus kochii]